LKKYRPNLVELMNLSEVNYMLMMRLMGQKVGLKIRGNVQKIVGNQTNENDDIIGSTQHFFISDFLYYTITLNELTRYTSLVTMEQDANIMGGKLSKLFKPKMIIRLYHDARMVEIISSQDIHQIKPRYDYPNQAMHQTDEKRQLSQFLKEWLQICHKQGQVKVSLPKTK